MAFSPSNPNTHTYTETLLDQLIMECEVMAWLRGLGQSPPALFKAPQAGIKKTDNNQPHS